MAANNSTDNTIRVILIRSSPDMSSLNFSRFKLVREGELRCR